MPSSYTLGVHFEDLIKGLVESGRYNNASEVVRDGLRLLEEREKLREIKVAELRRLAEEGRLSGLSERTGKQCTIALKLNTARGPSALRLRDAISLQPPC